MRFLKIRFVIGFTTLLVSSLDAQTHARLGVEAVLGLAHRTPNQLDLPADGFQLGFRGIRPLTRHLRLILATSYTRFGSHQVPSACPAGLPCAMRAPSTVPGVDLLSLTTGLQPLVPLGPLQLRVSGTGGGYWLAFHPSQLPALAPGLEAAVSLAVPVDSRLRVLLEGRLVHLLGAAGDAASHREVTCGIAMY